ncbi:hypothetical protein PF008_g22035 [Phytophthora fragariae]|uniref:Uncharacterized protein n=1 Tax=Phytophthora fragariae TaxID=53985 RepID=A0A6G0QUW7_9STRA|nr:hypothetical protein PF008_g22035 [Phytophthora fragariae]
MPSSLSCGILLANQRHATHSVPVSQTRLVNPESGDGGDIGGGGACGYRHHTSLLLVERPCFLTNGTDS